MMKREPASIVELDRSSNQVLVRRWGIMGRAASSYPLHALLGAEIESTQANGWRPGLPPKVAVLDVGVVPVSMFWYQKRSLSQHVVDQLERFAKERS